MPPDTEAMPGFPGVAFFPQDLKMAIGYSIILVALLLGLYYLE